MEQQIHILSLRECSSSALVGPFGRLNVQNPCGNELQRQTDFCRAYSLSLAWRILAATLRLEEMQKFGDRRGLD